jgi:type I restriction enzyme S subunit
MLVQSQWQTKKLGDICEMAPGGTPLKSIKEYWLDGKVSWYSSGELNELYTSAPRKCITHKGLDNSNTKLFPKGSLLIGIYDTAALKMSILDRQAAFNQAIVGIKPNSQIEVKFIFHIINAMKTEILSQRRGVRQKNLSFEKIKNIRLPLPPLPEQHRIVSILDEAFTEIDKAKKNTEENIKKNKELFEAKLQSVFSNPSGNWQLKKLIEVCKLFNVRNTELNLPYVGMENIEAHSGKYIGSKSSQLVKSATFYFNSQCLLYGRLRPYLNKVLLPDFEGHCSTEIFPIKVNAEITKEYLFYWFILEDTAIKINKTSTGARMPRANMKEVLNFEIPLPSLPEQHRIITELDSISTETKKLEKLYRSKLTHLEELKKSILKQAFEGKL